MPALVLNYFGQGAMLIENPAAISNPVLFDGARVVVVAAGHSRNGGDGHRLAGGDLGVFSVTTQAVSLGCLPRVRVEHSSADVPDRSTCRP
jgi:KUP system potassium uptake protein